MFQEMKSVRVEEGSRNVYLKGVVRVYLRF